ncbi:MAG TPA: hypothetical protein VEI97_02340, partial [bacterium]|nr:hypothetical protein [bacterium]
MPFDGVTSGKLPQVVRDLLAARALIADPAHWTRHMLAMGADGLPTAPRHEAAVSFCVRGAIFRVTGEPTWWEEWGGARPRFEAADRALAAAVPADFELPNGLERPHSPALFNNSRSHAEVLDLIDRAVAQ